MVDRNSNKIARSLIYAVLEWTLILLLLLNSLFSFLIIKFSQYFALKPPCLWCSTLHRYLEPQKINSHRDLLCEFHSKEVSCLGFCPNHNKLAEIKDFCQDCFSSHLGFQSEVKQSDGDEQKFECSCCGLKIRKKSVSRTRSCWDVLEYTENGDLVVGIERKIGSNDQIGSDLINGNLEIQSRKENRIKFEGKDVSDSNSFEIETHLNQFEKKDDSTSGLLSGDLEFFFDYSGSQLVPIELVDSSTEESQNVSEADEEHQKTELESMELEETENSLVFNAKIIELIHEKSAIVEETRALFVNSQEHEKDAAETDKFDPDAHSVHEEAEVSIGTWIPVLDSCVDELSTKSHELHLKIENGEDIKLNGNHSEIEEEKIPDTPGSVLSLGQLHTKLLTIERKESGAEESFDGSVMSEIDGGDPTTTVEKLKSALKAERKALHALYAELEAERGASAVAASETMAMINRLQEEKAAMQMDALHYQRMMEEQSEYDQEALQLLNDLMIKREKELESYRKKVADYEVKERMRFSNSTSCSHSEDGDKMMIETNNESNGNRESRHHSIPVPNDSGSSFLGLESSLTDFEKERLSILEQLKVLEVKLFALSDEEDPHFADVRPIEDFYDKNGELSGNGFNTIDLAENTLAPLFDIGIKVDDKVTESNGFHPDELENDKKRFEIEEEVDQVYERLQALEADREFLKHCVGSLKKGDKGMELLQEILQHLRDLRTMDIHQ
ncbi:Zein-binding domain-containing protein [Cynara cardunculus var. scolymus]|uniref:Zein-binding domain-containing protein n=2 Tax=Cynara cardunculus var. scolymus TaxID=59895 RepID=A0A103XSS1_CYNCS|nr:Zein-binding domain-containing protein [Cynara cardunculus var. scolymus]